MPPAPEAPLAFVLDCDPGSDCDDAGDIGMINVLMTRGYLDMVAATTERTLEASPSAIDVINTYYGHGSIPIGANKGSAFLPNDTYAAYLAANFPNDVTYASAPEAVGLLRATLAARVTPLPLLCTGPLRLISELLQSAGGDDSPLAGAELVAAKVSELIVVAGRWNTPTPEYNFYKDPAAGSYVMANCPVPITIVGCELGDPVITGKFLTTHTPVSNPVRKAFELQGLSGIGQSAWAQLAVVYLAYGLAYGETVYFSVERGTGAVNSSTGAVTWTPSEAGPHTKLAKVMSDADLAALINDCLYWIPA